MAFRRARQLVHHTLREVGSRGILRSYLLPRYAFNFRPAQLCFLVQCLDETSGLDGAVVEIGCSEGRTTLFLCKHLSDRDDPRRYICVDTFSGFPPSDVAWEREQRGKEAPYGAFSLNHQRWFDATMRLNDVRQVSTIAADVNEFDFARLGPVSFALIDVDLYRPVTAALKGLQEQMVSGGIIVVDDCRADHSQSLHFDGAYYALRDFLGGEDGMELVENKLGVLRVP